MGIHYTPPVACCSGGGGTFPLRRAFKGVPKQHLGASYVTGNSIVILSFACHSPIILARTNDHVKLSLRNERRMFPSVHCVIPLLQGGITDVSSTA